MTPKVCILDYGSGNVKSVFNLVAAMASDLRISNDVTAISEATHFILPGVGAFGASMAKIRDRIPLDTLEREVFEHRKPFLGICVGLQVMAERGYEFGEHEGLGWVPGIVDRLNCERLPLPHVGWNSIRMERPCRLLEQFDNDQDFYFVHSYVFRPSRSDHVAATARYGEEFCCVLNMDNLYGVQFHPEKSQKAGRILIANFLNLS